MFQDSLKKWFSNSAISTSLLFCSPIFAQTVADSNSEKDDSKKSEEDLPGETIEVVGERIRSFGKGLKESDLNKTEILDGDSLQRFGAQTLADAISQARGVDTQLFCANCGAKRITINGLRGEHTTVLIDGFPLHSTVSSFYGLDAVPIIGIDRIEVNRGAGSSLIAPESIGGSINLITREAFRNSLEARANWGSEGSHQTSVIASGVDENTSLLVMFDDGYATNWDEDDNGIAESPERFSRSATFKLNQKISERLDLKVRYSESDLVIIGGNTVGFEPRVYSSIQAQPSDFVNNDVREQHIGDVARITEYIQLSRKEAAARATFYLTDDVELNFRISQSTQFQNGFYSHAFDYNNIDVIDFGGIEARWLTDDNHLLSFGIEAKNHRMSSNSQALYIDRNPPIDRDNFEYYSRAAYISDEWQPTNNLHLGLALRLDQIDVKWTDIGTGLDELIVAPRLHAQLDHNEHVSSRLSLGKGYRPPLTIFESEHGGSHDGFTVAIDEVEEAYSAVYTFSLNFPEWFSTWSAHWTRISNLAYAIDRVSTAQPLLFVNSNEDYDIFVADWYVGGKYHFLKGGEWQLGFESFHFTDGYTEKLPTAAQEFRIIGDFSQQSSLGTTSLQAIYVGARDLTRYGYDEHFNRYDLDISSPTFNEVSAAKKVKVPGFLVINFNHQIALSKDYGLGFRVNNVTDYTQTGSENDSPATWHWHETHGHFDNFHTWGPNQGREYFIELSASY